VEARQLSGAEWSSLDPASFWGIVRALESESITPGERYILHWFIRATLLTVFANDLAVGLANGEREFHSYGGKLLIIEA
jgi:hypothetical protein